jgi:periplasmic divalent cation tolerance protein
VDPQQSGSAPCQVVTTVGSAEEARHLAESTVLARLAACAQVSGPLTSIYWWEGEVNHAEEWQVVFKTAVSRYDDLQTHILDNHPYDVPEILCLPVIAGNPAYVAWLREETAAPE